MIADEVSNIHRSETPNSHAGRAMDPERWKALESLYHAVLAVEPGGRLTFLDAACPDDAELRWEVETLIEFGERNDPVLAAEARAQGSRQLDAGAGSLPDAPGAPPQARFEPGAVLGERFRIVRWLGAGGMGEVYEAADTVLGEQIALKVIRRDIADREDVLPRFVREVQSAKKIAHPNICRIHDLHQHLPDAGQGEEITFLTMELLQGETLRARLDRGAMELTEAQPIAEQLSSALDAAHRVGVVHCDFKCENVILTDGDAGSVRAVVTDFGLARSRSASLTSGFSRSASLTGAEQLIGTPAYMAPEQLLGEPITHAVDIYALGVVLYEMVTATQPFTGESPFAVAVQRLSAAPPPPSKISPGLPGQWDAAILGCLEFYPAKRFSNALDVGRAIRGMPDLRDSSPAALPARRRPPYIALWAVLTVVLSLTVAGLLRWRPISRSGRAPAAASGIYMAVLPFKVPGNDETLRYRTEGIADALASRLFQLPDVHLASRAALDSVKGQPPAIAARRLGVTMLVNGSVENSGNAGAIAVVVSLEDLRSQRLIWTDRFSADARDLLTLEDQISIRLIRALNATTNAEQRARAAAHPTENIEAYDLYLKGRGIVRNKRDEAALKSAIDLFTKAISKDPRFGLAYASLADACVFMYDLKKDGFWLEKALHAGAEAERWSPDAPESHTAMGSAYRATGRTSEAIVELKRAIEFAPNSDEAFQRLASAYADSGDTDQAITYYNKAIGANPFYWMNYNQAGRIYVKLGQYSQAMQNYLKVTEIAPDLPSGYTNVAAIYMHEGQYQNAIERLEKAILLHPTAPAYTNMAACYYYLGQFQRAVENGEKALALNSIDEAAEGNLADAYRWSGQAEKARAAYERAIALAYASLQVNPRKAEVAGHLALYYAKLGQFGQARQFIERARGADANDVELIFSQAMIESLSGNDPAALRDLGLAVDKGFVVAQIESEPDLSRLRRTKAYRTSRGSWHGAKG